MQSGAEVRAVVILDGFKNAFIAVLRIRFHLRTLEAWEADENRKRLVGDRGTVYTCLLVLNLSAIVLEMRTTLSSVGHPLFGSTRGRVLALLYGVPDETFFVRQIARQVETSAGTVQPELVLLADVGLIKRSASAVRCSIRARYSFDGAGGEVTLADLFEGRRPLIVQHFMFGPDWNEGCIGCSFKSDHVDGALAHHDVTVAAPRSRARDRLNRCHCQPQLRYSSCRWLGSDLAGASAAGLSTDIMIMMAPPPMAASTPHTTTQLPAAHFN